MGNEFSWPCADRKDQQRRMQNSRYEAKYHDNASYFPPIKTEKRIGEIESIINRKRMSPEPHFGRSGSVQSVGSANGDSLSASSYGDRGPRIIIKSEQITNFKAFMDEVAMQYENIMMPTHITMHPCMNQAIVVLQACEFTDAFRPDKSGNTKYKHYCKRFEPVSRSVLYQELTTYLRAYHEKGLEFVGCFTQDQVSASANFNFIFTERVKHKGSNMFAAPLQFEMLDDVSASTVERVLTERIGTGYHFKGMVNWDAAKDSVVLSTRSAQNKSLILSGLHLMIFEKEPQTISNYHVIEIPQEELDPHQLEHKLSRNIEGECEINKFELSGIISNTENQSILLILSEG